MGFVRKSALGILYSLFAMTLFAFGLLFSIKMVLGTPLPLEHALAQSSLYTVVTQQVIQDNKDKASPDLPLDQTAVQAAVEKAFPPTLLEQSVNQVLDGTYAWLQGRSSAPNFRIDLSGAKTNLANYAAAAVQQRLGTLPACTVATLPANLNAIDPYTTTCLPPQFNKAAAVERAKQAALTNTDVLDDPVITADTLKNDDGKTVAEQLQNVPRAYRDLMTGVTLTGITAITAGIGIVFLHRSRRAGVRRVCITMLSLGALSAGMALVGNFVLKRLGDNLEQRNQATHLLEAKLMQVMHLLADDLRHWWLLYGIGLVVLALGGLLGQKLFKAVTATPAPPEPALHPPRS